VEKRSELRETVFGVLTEAGVEDMPFETIPLTSLQVRLRLKSERKTGRWTDD